jgi:hypothetical protein
MENGVIGPWETAFLLIMFVCGKDEVGVLRVRQISASAFIFKPQLTFHIPL